MHSSAIPTSGARSRPANRLPKHARPVQRLLAVAACLAFLTPIQREPAAAQGRAGGALESFFPLHVGDLWTYETNDLDPWARTVSEETVQADGTTAYRIDESSEGYRNVRLDDEGLTLLSLHFDGGVDIEFEEPVLLFPRGIAESAIHRVEARYAVIERGVRSHEGTQTFVIERLVNRSVDTQAGGFPDCMVFRITSRREADTGAVAESTVLEIRAAEVGLVRIERGLSEEGEWIASLTGASVAGRLLPL